MKISGVITLLVICIIAMAAPNLSAASYFAGTVKDTQPPAIKGTIDLRRWDFDRSGPVELSGQWEFYWKQLLQQNESGHRLRPDGYMPVPGIWNDQVLKGIRLPGEGFATYRLSILLPEHTGPGAGKLAVMVHDMGTAYTLFINGSRAGGGGRVGDSPETSLPGYWPAVVDFESSGNRVDIMLHISNFNHRKGGAWDVIVLGPASMLHDMRERKIAIDFFLVGSIFLMGAYYLVLFSLRKKDRSYLFFGIFCLLIAARVLVTGEYYALRLADGLSWESVLRSEYLTFYAGVPVFFAFVQSLFPLEFSKKALACILAPASLLCASVVLAPSRQYTHSLQPCQALTLAASLYGLCALALSVARRRDGAVPCIFGFIIMFGAVINDVLKNNMLIQGWHLVPPGLFIFIFSQAFLLSRRFSRSMAAVDRLTGELEEKNRRLLDLDRLKDDFLASVSHEIRNPLNGIIGLVETMIDGRFGKMSLESRYNLGLIRASGRRLAGLVNDLLDFVRLKNRDMTLNRGPVDLKIVADIVLALSRPLVLRKKIELINDIRTGAPLVFADENRTQQVLHNLVDNAVRHTLSGHVAVSARAVMDKGWMEISVSDTGIGIATERLNCIFDGYDRNDGGTGIGLSISRQIVELHGGSIWAGSVPGTGSVFTFTLPLLNDGAAAISARSAAAPAMEGPVVEMKKDIDPDGPLPRSRGISGRVLVVDDDAVILELLKGHLVSEDYDVVPAMNGAEALEALRKGHFDLVLTDLVMPGMSGHELCGEIRKRYSRHELPVIIVTARQAIVDLVAGFEKGANDYLAKPVHRDELLARVRTLVTLKQTVRDHDEAKYNLLQERMGPHFLFNALNTVHALIRKDGARADRAVIILADNYRFIMEYSFRPLIPFDAEWRFVENYLELEQLRFSDSLTVNMERQGDFAGVRIPPLTLQPLVENALKHGLGRVSGQGMVSVSAVADDRRIRMAVRDNGAGLAAGDTASRSIGNIRKRLNHYFEEVDIDIENADGGGVRVQVSFLHDTAETERG